MPKENPLEKKMTITVGQLAMIMAQSVARSVTCPDPEVFVNDNWRDFIPAAMVMQENFPAGKDKASIILPD